MENYFGIYKTYWVKKIPKGTHQVATSLGARPIPTSLVCLDTSILHHDFMSIFIALWAVITHYISILIAILSYFTRFTMGNASSWNSG